MSKTQEPMNASQVEQQRSLSLCHSTIQTRATEAFPGGRGTSLALFGFSLFLGSALGSVGFGALLERVGYAATFGGAGLLLFAFTALALGALGRERLLETE